METIVNNKLEGLCLFDALVVINSLIGDPEHEAVRPVYNEVEDKIFAVHCKCGYFHPVFKDHIHCDLEISKNLIKDWLKFPMKTIFMSLI